MLQIKSKILYNKEVNSRYFHLCLQAPKIAKASSPGQFLNIKVNDIDQPLLRRPLSIHRVKAANIELLYEVVGTATEILSKRKPGEYLDVIGPLGSGFDGGRRLPVRQAGRDDACLSGRQGRRILVAGGMGVAPLVFLAERFMKVTSRPLVLIGAKTKNHILCEKEFKDLGCEVKIATDDGSKGFKGYVSELLKYELSAIRYPLSAIYACGPKPMLKEISLISKRRRIPAQVSLEAHMACGIGVCLGCVVNTKKGFKRACKEGPVFSADEIIWQNKTEVGQ